MTHGSMPASCRMPTAPSSRVTSHMSADIIIGCTISTGRAGRLGTGPGVGREVAPQPVHRHALDDLERRRHGAGLQPAVAQHFQTVLRGGHQPPHWPGYRRQVHHALPFASRSPDSPSSWHSTLASRWDCTDRRLHRRPYHRRLMANLINVERATVGYGTRTLLDGVSLGVDEGDAIGVVGRNGDGKTTLLQVLTATRAPDSGRVTHTSGLSVGYLRQADDFAADATVRDVIVGGTARPRLGGRTRHPVGRRAPAGRRRTSTARSPTSAAASGAGWRWPRCCWPVTTSLVLDEPTNHLDVEVIGWLAGHLSRRRPKALVVVSHDRWFLDAVCTRTWEVHDGEVDAYDGGYAAYVLARAERMRHGRRHRGASPQSDAQGTGVAATRPARAHVEAEVPHPGGQRPDRQRAAAARFACAAAVRDHPAGQGRVRSAPGAARARPIGRSWTARLVDRPGRAHRAGRRQRHRQDVGAAAARPANCRRPRAPSSAARR